MTQRSGRQLDAEVFVPRDGQPLPDGASVLLLGAVPVHVRETADSVAPSVISYAVAQRLLDALASDAIAAVCAESMLDQRWLDHLQAWASGQPAWSDLPFIVLLDVGTTEPRRCDIRQALGNVTFVAADEAAALRSALEEACRSRLRQWLLRDLLAMQRDEQASETRRSGEPAAHAERGVRTAMEANPTWRGLLDAGGAVLYANASGLAAIEAKLPDVLGAPFWACRWFTSTDGAPDRIRAAVDAAADGQSVVTAHQLNLPAGEGTFEISLRPVRDGQGAVVAIVADAFDVSARVALEAAHLHAQKMEAIGRLTAGVVHDFNNRLTVIKSSSDLLRRPDLSDALAQRCLNAISDTADRAARLTSQLIAFARPHASQATVFDASARMIAIGELMATLCGSRIQLTVDAPDGPCFIDADANQFETSLVNLVVNARDAMGGVGRVLMRIERREILRATREGSTMSAPFVVVIVQDTGPSAPSGRRRQVLDDKSLALTAGSKTAGGLAQVLGFAQRAGGELTVERHAAEGATFSLALHRANPPSVV